MHQIDPITVDQLEELEQARSIICVVLLDSAGQQTVEQTLPESVQRVLEEFQVVFDEPSGLPPQKPWDHAIPLLPGTKPVNVRPYRYTPEQKK